MLTFRCSALPRAFLCGASVRTGEVVINETGDEARMGSCAHEGLKRLVDTGRVDWEGVPELARRYDVHEPELRALLAGGAKLWALVKESFPLATTEVELDFTGELFRLTGHADLLAFSGAGTVVHVGDWKCGRRDQNYREQLLGYAALLLLADSSLESATAGVLWVRDGEYEHYTLTREALEAWLEELGDRVIRWDGVYRPGPHCTHCPRNHECAAANALIRRDVAAVADLDIEAVEEHALERMAPDAIVALLDRADTVSKYADRVRAAVKRHVTRNGDIEGTEWRLTLQHGERRKLDVVQGFPVLAEAGFGDEEMGQVLEFSLPKVERLVAKAAGKGKGAGAVREIRERLAAADAIQTEGVTSLVSKRK